MGRGALLGMLFTKAHPWCIVLPQGGIMDSLGKLSRAELMGRVRSSGTGPEKKLRSAMAIWGLKPSRPGKPLPGKPDFVFRRAKVAVVVDGCFWHACPFHGRIPSGEANAYWVEKLGANKKRDQKVVAQLTEMGWFCLSIWEHDLKDDDGPMNQALRVPSLSPNADRIWS